MGIKEPLAARSSAALKSPWTARLMESRSRALRRQSSRFQGVCVSDQRTPEKIAVPPPRLDENATDVSQHHNAISEPHNKSLRAAVVPPNPTTQAELPSERPSLCDDRSSPHAAALHDDHRGHCSTPPRPPRAPRQVGPYRRRASEPNSKDKKPARAFSLCGHRCTPPRRL